MEAWLYWFAAIVLAAMAGVALAFIFEDNKSERDTKQSADKQQRDS